MFDSTKQSYARQSITIIKAFGKTIKSPLFKQIGKNIKKPVVATFGNTYKNSVSMFHRSKNTIKNLASGLQKKYLKNRHYFGSKSVKYLGTKTIKNMKTGMAPC